ncbi:MAG: hypothetical protein JF622_09705 [Terrabacter sp.]|nr:hypothetical protein [Terrabacter sp.]
MSTAQEIRATLEPVLAPLGLVVEDVSVSPAGKRRLVRVLVDSDIAGLDAADSVEVVHQDGTDTGRLTEVGADSLTLEVPATKKTPARHLTLDLDTVQRGTVQVEFSRSGTATDAAVDDAEDDSSDAHDDTHDPDETSALEGDH